MLIRPAFAHIPPTFMAASYIQRQRCKSPTKLPSPNILEKSKLKKHETAKSPDLFRLRPLSIPPRLLTRKEVLPANAAPITHTPENAALVVKINGPVQLRNASSIHN